MRQTVRAVFCALALGLSACASAPAAQTASVAAADSALRAPRHVDLEGVYNFRDLGGYRTADGRRVKWGVLYRSAELSHATAADVAAIDAMGVRNIVDFRSTSERQSEPTTWNGEHAPHIFASDYPLVQASIGEALRSGAPPERLRQAFADTYPVLLEATKPHQRALFQELLQGEGATLFHCSAGKDRTGMAAALVLWTLGVPRETILADYEMSNRYAPPLDARLAQARLSPEAIQIVAGVDPSYLRTAFAYIEQRYGSIDAYIETELGVSAADRRRLRALYTE